MRLAAISIIISEYERAADVNALLHEYGEWILGRMGIPYKARGIQVISVVLDAPQDAIAALAGRLGRLHGVVTKVAFAPEAVGKG